MKPNLRPHLSIHAQLRQYLLAFCLGFGSLLIVFLPIMIGEKGYFIYYGDFNAQQIPFYNLANDAVRSGGFGWNWYTDLGVNFIGSYAFYLLGSPFFWLSTILPRSLVSFSLPILLALKHGVASLTAYAYIQRFVRNPNAALIGGLLYAFSGFQLFNLFFNHFQDVTAFFPLMLIAMEECVNHNRRGVFALAVALMGIINYFFFTGQVVFLVLYFILRCFAKDFHATPRKFFCLLWEAVIGVMLACFLLLPSALAILANDRVSEHLYGMNMIAYNDRTRIWRILLGMFMIPDVPARPNLFSSTGAKWASIGGYLPLFSMAGVLSFLKQKQGHWAKRIVIICAVCACIPILNSAFYALNGSYYARWFYMPILILAMMTAYALDNRDICWKSGLRLCFGVLGAFALISLLPVKDDDDKVTWFSFAEYPVHFYVVLGIAVGSLFLVIQLLHQRKKQRKFMQIALIYTTGACIACSMAVVYFGANSLSTARNYIDQAIDPENEISVSVSEDDFFRIDISKNCDNYPMFWQLPCMRTFHSVVPASIMEFYEDIGVSRDVASRADTSYYGLRGLFSVRYYYDQIQADTLEDDPNAVPECDLPGFVYEKDENGFHLFRNEAYIPMGFTYDYYISEKQWEETSKNTRSNLLLRAMVLNADQIEKAVRAGMKPLPSDQSRMSQEDYLNECHARAASACDSFVYDASGFTATISTDSPELVFFSVPYDNGWSASVNGKAIDIEQVNIGFMAVPVEAGESTIVFSYETPGLRVGAYISLGGLVLLIGYLTLCGIQKKRREPAEKVCCLDYAASAEPIISAMPEEPKESDQPQNPVEQEQEE